MRETERARENNLISWDIFVGKMRDLENEERGIIEKMRKLGER